jgi:hypothetical protein
MSRYALFDRQDIALHPLSKRGHDLTFDRVRPLVPAERPLDSAEFRQLVTAIINARRHERPVILIFGGHPIKLGLSRYLIDLMERGWITHLATNGAGIIHDFELALVGGTSEDVAKWIQVGQFGLWQETSRLNDIIREGAARGEGLGEAVGRTIEEERFPHRDVSLCAAGWRLGIPVTSHVTIGGDIIHAHPNCNGAALGATSYTDFLIFAASVAGLSPSDDGKRSSVAFRGMDDHRADGAPTFNPSSHADKPPTAGGVFLNIGSAVTGPEVYLKALSMARNVARQKGKEIRHFTTAVFDLVPLPANWRDGTPPSKDDPFYYYRPWKTILTRTVADGGQSFYIQADHRQSIPSLWQALVRSHTT